MKTKQSQQAGAGSLGDVVPKATPSGGGPEGHLGRRSARCWTPQEPGKGEGRTVGVEPRL